MDTPKNITKTPRKSKKTKVVDLVKKTDNPFLTLASDYSNITIELCIPLGEKGDITRVTMRRPVLNDTIQAEKLSEGNISVLLVTRMAIVSDLAYDDFQYLDEMEDFPSFVEAYGLLRTLPIFKTADVNDQLSIAQNRRSIKIKLKHPIKAIDADGEDVTYNTLTMRRPTLADGINAEKRSDEGYEQTAYKMAALCDVSVEVLKLMDDVDDFRSMEQAFDLFRTPKTSRKKDSTIINGRNRF